MKNYLLHDEWKIIEEGFNPEYNEISESCFSIGNGRFGQRANFEEQYSGKSLQGSYVAGVYYPDKTRVGWWKIGYPEYFAKVLNAPNWIGIDVQVDGEVLDLATAKVLSFRRELDMRRGVLIRNFQVKMVSGKELEVSSTRFCSMANTEVGAIRYEVKPLNFSGNIQFTPFVDADVVNQDANWDEKFWVVVAKQAKRRSAYITAETKKTAFQVCTGMKFSVSRNGEKIKEEIVPTLEEKFISLSTTVACKKGDRVVLHKYAGIISSRYYDKSQLMSRCMEVVNEAYDSGFKNLLKAHEQVWSDKWKEADIVIEGDVAAQQGIRFNIFQLYQTYTGDDPRLNIGPKGFTGEKYGGSTYWDTEAYCLPFYLATAEQNVARNLLVYRYRHLPKAIENAEKLGFTGGAALYPMVTMNGEECHNEWEITFEEIHRNGAIAYAIFDYIRYTGDWDYLPEYGLDVLIGIARFWAQRVHWSEPKQKFVMHGVTGPNEYENNINNNWYTNYIAAWCMKYTVEAMDHVKSTDADRWAELVAKLNFDERETVAWMNIVDNMYYPEDEEKGIFLQQEGFLDKEIRTVDTLKPEERPLNQNWSWDRILRSCFIKQADVLQGLYFFEDQFDEDTHRRNFEFYEPLTVHESSLSACVHAILASRLGMHEKAYEMYLRTARLDLDDYNNDTEDGLHITSMAGTWMALVEGFGGMRAEDDMLAFDPHLPEKWNSYNFHIRWRNHFLHILVGKDGAALKNNADQPLKVKLRGEIVEVPAQGEVKF
ncbi:MAG: family 65 glycosyl hydrolase [Saprospirales bacterium]|nr:family 65 glycosyl hydrolase [Saprospirales bacterium]